MLNWPDIDTVLLDMDGTLLDLSFDNFFWHHYLPEKYSEHYKLDLAAARLLLEEKSSSLKGSLNWYCVDYWSEDLKMDIGGLKAEVSHLVRFRPHTPEFLTFLREMNKQLVLVTNAHPKSLKVKADAVGLLSYLDKTVSSHNMGLAKENSGFWPMLEEQQNIDLSRSLFIDDSLPVLHCAQHEGVPHIVQILQPDTELAPVEPSDFMGITHFKELMTSHG